MDVGVARGPALAGLEPERVAREAEQAWYRLGRIYTASPEHEVLDRPGYTLLRGKKPGAITNHVFDLRLDRVGAEEAIGLLKAEHPAAGPALKWWLAPGSRPEGLEQRLLELGGRVAMELSAMALDLTAWPRPSPNQRPQRVENKELIAGAMLLFGQALGSDERTSQDRAELFRHLENAPGGEFSHYLITLGRESNHRIAATTSIQYAGEVATVLFVASDENFRGQGLAKACLTAALNEAAERGCKLAVLQATEVGQPLYHRLGFLDYGRLATVEMKEPV